MHRLHSKRAVFRFRVAALLLSAKCLLVPASIGGLTYSIIVSDHNLTILSLGIAVLAGVVILLQWMIAQRTNCPLCIAPILAGRECAKHRHARKLFGSHRLRIAASILFLNSFRCPYCNEPTALKVRERRHHPPYSRG